jgi:hypothetical protein
MGLNISQASAETRQDDVQVVEHDRHPGNVHLRPVCKIAKEKAAVLNFFAQEDHVSVEGLRKHHPKPIQAESCQFRSLGFPTATLE